MSTQIEDSKTGYIHIRVKPRVKDLAKRLAALENRSLANYIENFVLKEAKKKGIIDDIADQDSANGRP